VVPPGGAVSFRRVRRFQLFEINDLEWAPSPLRDLIIETLSRTLRWGRMLDGVVEPLLVLLRETGASEVLDVASGAGGPAEVLLDAMKRRGVPAPKFLLTDLKPQLEAWTALAAKHSELSFVAEPVDATRLAPELARGRVQLIINALHHLPPELARGVLREACRHAPGVMVAEGFERSPVQFTAFAAWGGLSLAVAPVLTPKDRVAKAVLAWATPIAAAASVWDGLVSTLRVYSEGELREMVEGVEGEWRWEYGTWRTGAFGRPYWFRGVRVG
jgi:hypothetical protein